MPTSTSPSSARTLSMLPCLHSETAGLNHTLIVSNFIVGWKKPDSIGEANLALDLLKDILINFRFAYAILRSMANELEGNIALSLIIILLILFH